MVFDRLTPCELTEKHKIKFNLYVNKKSLNVTEVRGNITALVDIDDSFFVSFKKKIFIKS